MSLFQYGFFTLASGAKSAYKIDCDALTDGDIETIAMMLVDRLPVFGFVMGVPTGGLRLAAAMNKYKNDDSNVRLIVDDVFTTGGSIERFKNDLYLPIYHPFIIGAVVFDRSIEGTPDWITSLFRMNNG